jgi:hypothetical protein
MKLKLDLTNVLNSDIGFKISQYPDGQQSISIEYFDATQSVQISSRMNSFRDVELIICANQVLKEYGVKNIELYVPYFIGGRSDRKFGEGQTNYLKNVICPIINSQGFNKVIVLDPHSDVLEACLNNFEKINNFSLVDEALSYLIKDDEDNKVAIMVKSGLFEKNYDILDKMTTIVKGVENTYKDANYSFVVNVKNMKPVQTKELEECKSKVINDYQPHLEATWVDELKKEFSVKVNQEVFEKAKQQLK